MTSSGPGTKEKRVGLYKGNDKMLRVLISASMDAELLKLAEAQGRTVSRIVRDAIREKLGMQPEWEA